MRKVKRYNNKRPKNHGSPTSDRTVIYRSLLVLLDQSPQCSARSQAAMRLAKALDCHLEGVAPLGLSSLPLPAQATLPLPDHTVQPDSPRHQVEQTTDRFLRECRAEGVKSFEAVIENSDKASSFVHHAHCNDLTILTKADPDAPDHRAAQDFVEHVVLQSARPTLILPYADRFDTIGTNVLVAWNASREAARALSDALPLLRLARHVHVVVWTEGGGDGGESQRLRFEALHHWLTRHGVSANVEVQETEIGIVGPMLARAAELKTDLIVMGAYNHRPSTAHNLGGITRGLLAELTIPVLMSH